MSRTTPVILDPELTQRAQARAEYLCTHPFSHEGWTAFFPDAKYKGENLARNYADALSTHAGLMNSPSHRANIQRPIFKKVGIGNACKENVVVELFTD